MDPALRTCVQLALAGPHLVPPPEPAAPLPLTVSAIARILHGARAPPAPPPPGQLLLLPSRRRGTSPRCAGPVDALARGLRGGGTGKPPAAGAANDVTREDIALGTVRVDVDLTPSGRGHPVEIAHEPRNATSDRRAPTRPRRDGASARAGARSRPDTTPTNTAASRCSSPPRARTWVYLPQRSSASTQRSSPLRGSKRLHQLSKRWAESREVRGLAGIQDVSGFVKCDADLRRKASADKGLARSASYCVQQ
jgi:hypothetical protein